MNKKLIFQIGAHARVESRVGGAGIPGPIQIILLYIRQRDLALAGAIDKIARYL